MPCSCDGPAPTLVEMVTNLQRQHEELYKCHQEKVAECDNLKARITELEHVILQRIINDPLPRAVREAMAHFDDNEFSDGVLRLEDVRECWEPS